MALALTAGFLTPAAVVLSPPATALPHSSPELVPFVGNFQISSTWGRPSGGYHSYPALDIGMERPTQIFAAGGGRATAVESTYHCNPDDHGGIPRGVDWCLADARRSGEPPGGTQVTIFHPDGRQSRYLHLSEVIPALRSLAAGQKVPVSPGQYIGKSGNTGVSTDPHLHYEERVRDSGDVWRSVDPGAMVACHGSSRHSYTGLQSMVGQWLRNDSMACSKYEGMVLQRTDGVSWVVEGGRRIHIPNFATEVCALYVRNLPILRGLSFAQANEVPEDTSRKYACDLNGSVLHATDGPEPRPSFRYRDNRRFSIPDADTWKYWTITRGARKVPAPRAVVTDPRLTDGGTEPARLYAPDWEGAIIRRDDRISWLVLGGQRHHLPTYAVDVCARFVQGRTVRGVGLVHSQTSSIPEGAPHGCDLNGRILRASNGGDPKPSFTYRGDKRYWIPDVWTYDYYVRRGFTVVDMPHGAITDNRLADGGTEPKQLDPQSIPVNSIIRRNDGVSWVVDGSRVRHHIPFAQDDVCWRHLGGRGVGPTSVSATDLTYAQANQLNEGAAWPCIIGDRVVRSSDGAAYFVDQANKRRWIPDSDTYWALARRHPVSGPWPASDVGQLPAGADMPRMLDPEAVKNTIVCRSDNVCWAVDGNGVRHHIPTHADNVCWRWVNGWHVSRNGVSAEQASSLPEADAWGCSMNDRIIATNEGPAYYMEGNTRRWIPDGYDFECLQRGRTVIRGMALAEANGIPEGGAMPAQECAGINIVTIYSPAAGRYVTTEIHYTGADYAMIRAARTSVGSDWERFRLIGDCSNRCLIQSLNNRKLVMPQLDYQGFAWGEMRGVSSNPSGAWEGFRLVGDCNTGCAILAHGNGRYVSTELDYSGAGWGMLRARATAVGGWERYVIR